MVRFISVSFLLNSCEYNSGLQLVDPTPDKYVACGACLSICTSVRRIVTLGQGCDSWGGVRVLPKSAVGSRKHAAVYMLLGSDRGVREGARVDGMNSRPSAMRLLSVAVVRCCALPGAAGKRRVGRLLFVSRGISRRLGRLRSFQETSNTTRGRL